MVAVATHRQYFATIQREGVFVVTQRLEQRSPDAILFLSLIAQTVDITIPVFALPALVAYFVSLALIIPGLPRENGGWWRMAIIFTVVTPIYHAIALKARIPPDGDNRQNLSLLNVDSLVSLAICTVMIIVASRNRDWLLLPIVYVSVLINLALAAFMSNECITHLEATSGMLVHIDLSFFSYAMLAIAAPYVLQLAWIDYQLKNKKLTFNQEMPPLMSIEHKMFHITQTGVVLLALTLCTGLFYMHNLFNMKNIGKAVLSIVAWFVYIVLLWEHYHEGRYRHHVIWLNVTGTVTLTLAYFGSRIIQQLIS